MDEIKVPSTRYHKIVNLLCIIILTGTLFFLVTNWTMIPDQIPGHYDSAGVINRWTSKSGLWIVYFVGIIMFAGLSVIEHFPKTWNTGVAITKENQKHVYQLIKGMIVTLKLCITTIFMFLTLYTTLMINLPKWFTPLFLIITFGSMIVYGIMIYRAR